MQVEIPVPAEIASPCVGICQLDAANICSGCGRSIGEIAEWSRAGAARRRHINELAAARRKVLGENDHE